VAHLIPNLDEGAFIKAEQQLKETMQKAKIITNGTSVDFTPKTASGPNANSQYGRNDKVVIEKDGEIKEVKFKKAEEFLAQGWKIK
jgi:hypothetical protein